MSKKEEARSRTNQDLRDLNERMNEMFFGSGGVLDRIEKQKRPRAAGTKHEVEE
tara:strand:- start:302 stop:463 length:162 start_codon:yes stop_codon:yes gene_type:complete